MILEFYGEECPHCMRMKPTVERLQKEGVQIETHEVWHDQANLEKMKTLDVGKCGAVPFFLNTDTGKAICGEATYEELKELSKPN